MENQVTEVIDGVNSVASVEFIDSCLMHTP